jgi:hypothetical protein
MFWSKTAKISLLRNVRCLQIAKRGAFLDYFHPCPGVDSYFEPAIYCARDQGEEVVEDFRNGKQETCHGYRDSKCAPDGRERSTTAWTVDFDRRSPLGMSSLLSGRVRRCVRQTQRRSPQRSVPSWFVSRSAPHQHQSADRADRCLWSGGLCRRSSTVVQQRC